MPTDSKKLVPKLRFPEFTDGWNLKTLGDITTQMQSGLSRRLSSSDIGLPVIRSNNIREGKLDISDISYWFVNDPQGANTKNYILNKGDLLVNFINSLNQIGKFALYGDEMDRDAIFTTNIMRLKFQKEIIPQFIADKFSRKEYRDYINSITKPAVNQASFTTVDFKQFPIAVPSFAEQQKIADFLTTVDEKIASIDKKIELLKQYKKAVMQKIFTQQLRFKDENGNNYPDWSTKKVADIYSFIRTNSASREVLWSGDGIKNIHYGDIHTNIPARLDVTDYDLPAFKDRLVTFAEHDYCQPRDVLMADASEDYKDIGKCIEIIRVGEQKVVGGLHTLLLRPSVEIAEGFGGYLFKSDPVRKQIQRAATGVSVLGISKANVAEIGILIPSPEEQRKISDFLGKIDDRIDIEERKLENSKQSKDALLQRMFT